MTQALPENHSAQPPSTGEQLPSGRSRLTAETIEFALLGLVLLLAFISRLPGLDARMVDLDAWRQTDTASIAHLFLDEPNIFYPRVFWGEGPGYVEAEFQLFPYVVSFFYRILGENALHGRLLAIALNLVSVLALYRIAKRYLPPASRMLVCAFYVFAPVIFRYSRQFMPESAVLLFYLLALERFLTYLERQSWSSILQASVAMCLAILVKPTSIHIGLTMMILAYMHHGWRFVIQPKLIAFALISLLPSTAYYLHAMNIYFTWGNTFGVIAGGDSKWTTAQQIISPRFYLEILQMSTAWMLGVVGALLAVAGIAIWKAKGWKALLLSWSLSFAIYCLVLGRSTGDYGRGLQYHVFSAPLIALAAGGTFAFMQQYRRKLVYAACAIAAGVIFAQEASQYLWVLRMKPNMTLYDAGMKLATVSQPKDRVAVLSRDPFIYKGLENNYQQPQIFYYAKRWGRSLPFDRQTGKDLERVLGEDIQWFVNIPEWNKGQSDITFHQTIQQRMKLYTKADGYEIYEVVGR